MAPLTASDGSLPSPSFKGRLKLEDFAFDPCPSAATVTSPPATRSNARRITRAAAKPTVLSATSTATVTTSRKRKAQLGRSTPVKRQKTTLEQTADNAREESPEGDEGAGPKREDRDTQHLSPPPPSPSTPRPRRSRAALAPPSTYAHLPLLPDAVAPHLLVLFVGLNPGLQTSRTGHAYAHPSNLFWRLLHASGITPRRCEPREDADMPRLFSLGLTNIIARPSRSGAELAAHEYAAGARVLEDKVRRWRPEVVCLVGKGVWEGVWKARHCGGGRAAARAKAEFRYGWQGEEENMGRPESAATADGDQDDGPPGCADERHEQKLKAGPEQKQTEEGVDYAKEWTGARLFVATSTSGLAASLRPHEKEEIWRELGVWVERRRAERESEAAAAVVSAN